MPQGLKPAPIIVGQIGTTEVVPFQNVDQAELFKEPSATNPGENSHRFLVRRIGWVWQAR
jgi:hypothetical protein